MGESFDEEMIRQALIQAEGNITYAAARCGLRRHRLVLFIETKTALQSLLFDIQEGNSDEAEFDLARGVFNGDPKAVSFYLRTAGRRRGYGKPMQPHEEAYVPPPPKIRFNEPALQPHHQAILDRALAEANQGKSTEQLAQLAQPAYFDRLDERFDDLRATLARNLGNLSRTARQFKVTRSELMEYMQTADVLQIVLLEVREEVLDAAESQLRRAIREHKRWAQQLQLELRSQGRGFSKYLRPMKPFWRDEPGPRIDITKSSPETQEQLRQMHEELGLIDSDASASDDARNSSTNFGAAAAVLAEDQESGDKNQESGVGNQKSGVRDQESGVGNQESGVGNQESGVGDQESGVGDQQSEVRDHKFRAPRSALHVPLEPLFPPGLDEETSAKMGDELRKRASVPGPDMERILARFRPPAEARLIVRNWRQLTDGDRATVIWLIFDHIESERHPWLPVEELRKPRPPTQPKPGTAW